ncbi:MAG: right-handed parallel beta-helix repeat-containing protein [Myxococcales bacterium]|nr:right-handed parallel beta-helix repeat-containing protein [Myxococcales bacterium]
MTKYRALALVLLIALAGCSSDSSSSDSRVSPDILLPDGSPPPPPSGADPAGLSSDSLSVQPCGGAVLCVRAGASGGDGSAASPFGTIGAAIAAASDGDTLQIAGGTYRENAVVSSKALALLGGFSDDFSSRVPATNVTTVEGVGGEAAVALIDAGKSTVEGLRITKGTGNELEKQYFILGGGLFARGGEPQVMHNLIEGNDIISSHNNPENQGGGVFFDGCDSVRFVGNVVRNNLSGRGALGASNGNVHIEGNVVIDNTAEGDHGGGIYVAAASVNVVNNLVERNKVLSKDSPGGGWGAGVLIYNEGTVATLSGNVVRDNYAAAAGSGVFIDDGAVATLSNELYANNQCAQDGGTGLYVDGADGGIGTTVRAFNVTIVNHRCNTGLKGAIYVEHDSSLTLANAIVWGNGGNDFIVDSTSKLEVRYSIVEQASIQGDGVIKQDPLFAEGASDFHLRSRAGRWDEQKGDWATDSEDSPAIDSGDPADPVKDESAPNGGRINMGAYGGTARASRSQ